ncbi:MAG: hypothetical protein DCC55_39215 [Chloroflexi bacterium]|nr:MAG: hypothetical protein DCC55_39215 [Chloroflexota bacterium]
MSAIRYLPEEELIKRGVKALVDELGPLEAMRFLNLPRAKRLESVRRHRRWQATLDQQRFFAQVFQPSHSER